MLVCPHGGVLRAPKYKRLGGEVVKCFAGVCTIGLWRHPEA